MAYYKVTTEDGQEKKIIANHIHAVKRIIIELAKSPLEAIEEITHKEFHGNSN